MDAHRRFPAPAGSRSRRRSLSPTDSSAPSRMRRHFSSSSSTTSSGGWWSSFSISSFMPPLFMTSPSYSSPLPLQHTRLNDSQQAMHVHLKAHPSRHPFYSSSASPTFLSSATPFRFLPRRPRTFKILIVVIMPLLILLGGFLCFYYLYEPHVELSAYNRNWVTKHIKRTASLSEGTCFRHQHSGQLNEMGYNATEGLYGARRTEVQAGMVMRLGMDCYNFAGTIQRHPLSDQEEQEEQPTAAKTQFHTYWRSDLVPFGPRQEYMLKSFFATQNVKRSRLVLWSNGDLSTNSILASYLRRYPRAFALRVVDIRSLAKGTALEGKEEYLVTRDRKAWVDGDLIRLLLLWNYGGVWLDMDSLLTRDMEPLLEHEFVTQWDCYDKAYSPFNGAVMRFRKGSAYLCEAFHLMATSSAPRTGSTDWGSLLYYKLWKALVAKGIPPFKVLPFCFTDGRSCRLDNRLPDPFTPDHTTGKWTMGIGLEKGGGLDETLKHKVFSVHLHNQWEKEFPTDGWVERLLLKRYNEALGY